MHSHNFEDLTGKIFGCYEVMNEAPPKITPSGKKNIMWHCRCIYCHDEKDIAANHIKRRPNKCVKCGKKKSTLIDLTGQIIGDLLVNERAPGVLKNNGKYRTMWYCSCLACGKNVIMDLNSIKKQKSCGCVGVKRNQIRRTKDFTGQKVGRLLVEKRVEDYVKPSGGTDRQWQCLCDCGKRCIKSSQYLNKSPAPSCGCWKSEITSELRSRDLTGLVFGWLLVEEKLQSKRTYSGYYKSMFRCKCLLCGSETQVSGNCLVKGNTKSCGCLKSAGEMNIRKWLNEKNIDYTPQYFFRDLYYTDPAWPLMFDFGILNEEKDLLFLIEFQGKQHFQEVDKEGKFGKQQREVTDQMKRDYCKAHNISLFEIRYDEDIPEALERIFTTYVNFVPNLVLQQGRCNDHSVMEVGSL